MFKISERVVLLLENCALSFNNATWKTTEVLATLTNRPPQSLVTSQLTEVSQSEVKCHWHKNPTQNQCSIWFVTKPYFIAAGHSRHTGTNSLGTGSRQGMQSAHRLQTPATGCHYTTGQQQYTSRTAETGKAFRTAICIYKSDPKFIQGQYNIWLHLTSQWPVTPAMAPAGNNGEGEGRAEVEGGGEGPVSYKRLSICLCSSLCLQVLEIVRYSVRHFQIHHKTIQAIENTLLNLTSQQLVTPATSKIEGEGPVRQESHFNHLLWVSRSLCCHQVQELVRYLDIFTSHHCYFMIHEKT